MFVFESRGRELHVVGHCCYHGFRISPVCKHLDALPGVVPLVDRRRIVLVVFATLESLDIIYRHDRLHGQIMRAVVTTILATVLVITSAVGGPQHRTPRTIVLHGGRVPAEGTPCSSGAAARATSPFRLVMPWRAPSNNHFGRLPVRYLHPLVRHAPANLAHVSMQLYDEMVILLGSPSLSVVRSCLFELDSFERMFRWMSTGRLAEAVVEASRGRANSQSVAMPVAVRI